MQQRNRNSPIENRLVGIGLRRSNRYRAVPNHRQLRLNHVIGAPVGQPHAKRLKRLSKKMFSKIMQLAWLVAPPLRTSKNPSQSKSRRARSQAISIQRPGSRTNRQSCETLDRIRLLFLPCAFSLRVSTASDSERSASRLPGCELVDRRNQAIPGRLVRLATVVFSLASRLTLVDQFFLLIEGTTSSLSLFATLGDAPLGRHRLAGRPSPQVVSQRSAVG